MSQYERKTYGPGDIAALPPTIGLTSRGPTIGAEDVGRPIPPAMPGMTQRPNAVGAPVKQAGLFGMGTTNGDNGGWMLPAGIGLAIGVGLAWMLRNREEEAALAF